MPVGLQRTAGFSIPQSLNPGTRVGNSTDPDWRRLSWPGRIGYGLAMKFGYVILYVKDVPRSVAFYEDAFGLQRRFVHEAGMYGEMDTGSTLLAFAANGLAKSNLPCGFEENHPSKPPGGFEVAFTTDDVTAAYDRALAAGATPVSPPASKPWGQIVAFVRDKDGIVVELCTPSKQS
jgi:catechol 2,3-dioxygenase-like lactoylglutathione lyase family enzyme